MKLAIILGSTREGRVTERLAKWAMAAISNLPEVEAEILDLRDFPMPFFDEDASPRSNPNRKLHPEVKKWLDKLDGKDAFLIVTPEYNHGIPAALKNALDYIDWQVSKKPFAIISHGSTGGARATSSLKITISEIHGVAISSNVALTFRVREHFDELGVLDPELAVQDNGPQIKLQAMLEELKWYSDALATARSKQ